MEEGLCQNSVPGSDFVDKTRIVEAKPLRSLAPVLPKSLQSSLSGRYPSVFPPYVLFEEPQESQPSPAPMPAPIRSYRDPLDEEEAPHGANGETSSPMEGLNGSSADDGQKRAVSPMNSCKSSQKRSKKTKESQFDLSSSVGEEEAPHGANGETSSPMEGLNGSSADDGQKRAVSPMNSCKSSQKRSKKTKESQFDLSSSVGEEEAPHGANGETSSPMEGLNGSSADDGQKRAVSPMNSCKSSQKRSKKTKESQFDLSSSVGGISVAKREDGDREVVNLVLMTYDSLRRRLCQIEDAKELNTTMAIKRADLRASNVMTGKAFRTNMRRRVGAVPGVEIGDIFFLRMEMCLVGLHGQSMSGIDYMTIKDELQEETVALSIVSSGVYDNDAEDNDVLIYSGQGENFNKKDKHMIDQKLQRGNLALDRSSRRHNEVRVIRGLRDAANRNAKIYVYDGLYKIQDSWIERGISGGGVFKYKFVRLSGQPSAFAVWKSVQKWKTGSSTSSRTGLILADLSTGVESIPVSLVNEVDNEKGPSFFTYFHSLKDPKPFSLPQSSYGCNCNKTCVPGDLSCSCIQRNEGDFPYTANGVLVSRKPLIHECGPLCKCSPNCKNRVSQTGLKHQMEVFKTKDRGWGLRSLDPIRAGTFICEYAGEVIDVAKVNKIRGYDDEYVFDTSRIYNPIKWNYEPSLLEEISSNVYCEDYDIPSPLIISSKKFGNVARYMNHSCSPNVFWQPVLYAENNQSFLHIAFFALRHIPPMTELTYDYGCSGHADGSSAPKGRKKCLCGSSKCRGSFG